jgi:hypothetical protein
MDRSGDSKVCELNQWNVYFAVENGGNIMTAIKIEIL